MIFANTCDFAVTNFHTNLVSKQRQKPILYNGCVMKIPIPTIQGQYVAPPIIINQFNINSSAMFDD
jgi:hypothetical protein